MAVMLPILAAVALGVGAGQASLSIAIALAVITAALAFAYRYGDRIGSLVFHPSDEVTLLSVFGLALVVAGLAEAVSISAAVGAFLVGIALSGEAATKAHSLLMPLRDLFAAVFFVFFGLSTDPREIPAVLGVAVALGIVTTGTKMLTGWWAAKRSGVARAGRLRAGLALVARGEFSIIIAGLAGGLTGADELAALAAAYVLLMAVAGPIAAKFAESGRQKVRV
jgi:CPA2 family monovalent cation:H+ antiporter-2